MATLLIPTSPGVPYFTQKTRLDGRDYLLRFAYNERAERFSLSIYDESDEPLIEGLWLVANWPLLRHYRHDARLPPGELWVSDLTGDGSPPRLDELGEGRRCELTYFEAAT
jgi:hypothetical protein